MEIEILESRNHLSTFVVTSPDMSGPGTLEDAIISANISEGADTIWLGVDSLGTTETITESITLLGNEHSVDGFLKFSDAPNSLVTNIESNGINADGSAGMRVRNSTIVESTEYGILARDSPGFRVVNCSVSGSGADGIRLMFSPGSLIIYTLVEKSETYGVLMAQSTGSVIAESEIRDNGRSGVILSQTSHALVRDNFIHHNGNQGVNVDNTIGVGGVATGLAHDNRVLRNQIEDNGKNGVLLFQSFGNLVSDNVCLRNNRGLMIWGDAAVDNTIIGNTLLDNMSVDLMTRPGNVEKDNIYKTLIEAE